MNTQATQIADGQFAKTILAWPHRGDRVSLTEDEVREKVAATLATELKLGPQQLSDDTLIKEELDAVISVHDQIGVYDHAYTHFKVTLHAFWCRMQEGEPTALEASEIRWVGIEELGEYPMGKIDRMISDTLGGVG